MNLKIMGKVGLDIFLHKNRIYKYQNKVNNNHKKKIII